MNNKFNKLFTFDHRLNRTGFLHSLLFLIVALVGLNIVLDMLLTYQLLLSVDFLVAKRSLEILAFAVWSPFIVRRLHDIGLGGKWLIVCWISMLLDQRLLLLFEVIYGIKIIAPVDLLMVLDFVLPAFILWLLLKPGEIAANRWGEPQD